MDGYVEPGLPERAGLRRRLMVPQNARSPGHDQDGAKIEAINGYLNAPIRARPGVHSALGCPHEG